MSCIGIYAHALIFVLKNRCEGMIFKLLVELAYSLVYKLNKIYIAKLNTYISRTYLGCFDKILCAPTIQEDCRGLLLFGYVLQDAADVEIDDGPGSYF